MARKEDLKPIVLTGELAGKEVDANGEGLTHELCRKWKLYCPECYQFVHLRQSNTIKSYFAHYDVEDKSCEYREASSSSSTEDYTETSDSKGQNLEKIQGEFENIFSEFYGRLQKSYYLNLEDIATLDLENITNECQKYLKCIEDLIFIKLIREQENFEGTRQNNPKINLAVMKVLSIDMNKHLLKKLIKYIICMNYSTITGNYKYTKDTLALINELLINSSNKFTESSVHNIIEIITNINWITKEFILVNERVGYYIPFYSQKTGNINLNESSNSNITNSRYNFPQSDELLKMNSLASKKQQNIFHFNLTAESIKLSKGAKLVEKYPYSLVTVMGYVFEVKKDGKVIAEVQLSFETGLSIQLPAKASAATKKIFPLVEEFFYLKARNYIALYLIRCSTKQIMTGLFFVWVYKH